MSFKYPLATTTWDEKEIAAMHNVIDSMTFTMGHHVKQFEEKFAAFTGSRYAIMVNSGSSANLVMIAALFYSKNPSYQLKRGDEVIVPAVSWSTTYFPLYQYGLKLKFVDINLETLNLDVAQLASAITQNTRAILAVNLLGNPNDYNKIKQLIEGKNILLLEDNCESMGATYEGKQAGTFGLMGTYSTFFSHHISTMEGGLVVTNDEELYQIMLSLRAHGWTRNLPQKNLVCGKKSDDPFDESFRFVLPGYNLRPLELSGAIGLHQIEKLPNLVKSRRENAKLLQTVLSNHPDIMIQKEIGESSWFGFSLLIRPESSLTRNTLINRLNFLGFESRPIVAGNFAKNEVIKYFNFEVHGHLKNSEYIDMHGLFIGNHHYSIDEAIHTLSEL
jgi:CDP-4-dehydro-6-deoxyglucose reductase, E1